MSRPEVDPLQDGQVAGLFHRHAADLRRFAYGVLRDAALAEDVVQVCFAKFAEHATSDTELDAEGARAWLFKVAYNESITILRRRKVHTEAIDQLSWLAAGESMPRDAPAQLERKEQIERVREAIGRLPEKERDVVKLRVYQHLKFREIADELGIPLGTALTRMRAGLAKLASQLEPPDRQD